MNDSILTRQRQEYCRALEQALEQIRETLAGMPEVQYAILFGSYAEGRRDLLTDLDILVVIESPLDFVSRTAEMYRRLSVPVDLDLLVYTPEEVERNRDRPFVRQALEKGKVIYAKRAA